MILICLHAWKAAIWTAYLLLNRVVELLLNCASSCYTLFLLVVEAWSDGPDGHTNFVIDNCKWAILSTVYRHNGNFYILSEKNNLSTLIVAHQ